MRRTETQTRNRARCVVRLLKALALNLSSGVVPLFLLFLFLISIFLRAADRPAVQYTDVTEQSGVHFQARNSATSQKYLIETMIGGVGVLDFDNDGWFDIFFVNGAQLKDPQADGVPLDKSAPEFWNRLFRNNRDGTFTDVTQKAGVKGEGYGNGVAVADYDNDGFDDLLVTNYGPCLLYRNKGDGTFVEVTGAARLRTEGWSTSAAWLDYNRDGWLDLFVCRYLEWSFSRNPYCGHESAGGRAYCHPNNFPTVASCLFKNNGDGTFTDVSEPSGIAEHKGYALGVAVADFNNDGWTDISVANDKSPQFLFMNNADGTFSEYGALSGVGYTDHGSTFSGMGTDAADLNDDGNIDIITTALSNETFGFFVNNGDGSFTPASTVSSLAEITKFFAGWGMRVYDYDNDGYKDVFLANSHVMDTIEKVQPHLSYLQPSLLLKGDGKRFHDVSTSSGTIFEKKHASRGAAFGDLDNDGDVDVVISNLTCPAMVLRNDGGNANNWVGLDLRGARGNRRAIGARIQLTSGSGKTQHYQVTTASSYQSANDPRVFIGTGSEKIRTIVVKWPSGLEQKIESPKSRQILRIEEPRQPK